MEYLLILNTFRIPRSSLDIQDGQRGDGAAAEQHTDRQFFGKLPDCHPEKGLKCGNVTFSLYNVLTLL